jgi:hypothetical protein
MHFRALARVFALICVAALAAAAAAHAAPAINLPPPTTVPDPVPLPTTGWWTCPATGGCSAPTLRMWLPSFGNGYTTVESGPVSARCGVGCYEIPNGALITIRAVANPGYRFTGWGGKCQTVSTTGCYFHMWNNYTAAATFEPLPSSSGGSSNSSSDPVTAVLDFVVQVSGRGTVAVQGTGSIKTSVCTPPYPCTMTRFLKRYVQVQAISTGGGRFLGWSGGRCWGTQTVCTFKNDFDRYNNRARIVANFG